MAHPATPPHALAHVLAYPFDFFFVHDKTSRLPVFAFALWK